MVERGKIEYTIWDCGGGDRIRPLYRHYYPNTQCLGWWIDCTDRDRLEESVGWLWETLLGPHGTGGTPQGLMEVEPDVKLVVFANKQDVPNAMTAEEIIQRLIQPTPALHVAPHWPHEDGVIPATVGLEVLLGPLGGRWHVQPSSASSGNGLEEALEWFVQTVKES